MMKNTSLASVADPGPGSGAFLTPGSEMAKNQKPDPGSGMNIPDHISESLETIFGLEMLKFFDADPVPGSGIFLTLDLGWKTSNPG
jgi:hypothetical protein